MSDTANKTYAYDNTTLDIIFKLHLEKITQLRVEASEEQQDLSKLYWILKCIKHHTSQDLLLDQKSVPPN